MMQLDESDSSDGDSGKVDPQAMFAASHSAAFPKDLDNNFQPGSGGVAGLDFGKLGKKAEKIAASSRGGKTDDILSIMGAGAGIEEQIMAQIQIQEGTKSHAILQPLG